MPDNTWTCAFCDHAFASVRRRKFCYDCLPPHGDCADYTDRYNTLYRACGLNPRGNPPQSRWTPPKPPKADHPCAGCDEMVSHPKMWCSATCRARHKRHGVRAERADRGVKLEPFPMVAPVLRWEVGPVKATVTDDPRRAAFRKRCAILPPTDRRCTDCGCMVVEWWTLRPGEKSKSRCYDCFMDRAGKRSGCVGRLPQTFLKYVAICPCLHCGAEFRRDGGRLGACSPECSQALKRERSRRRGRARRTAAVGIPYTLHEVATAARCKCHLCGRSVNMALSGRDPMGPSIDHLLPLADGGLDCRTNVALAHLSCNVSRGTRGTVQLRLVG